MDTPVAEVEPSVEGLRVPQRIEAPGVLAVLVLAGLFLWRAQPYDRSVGILGALYLATIVSVCCSTATGWLLVGKPAVIAPVGGGALLRTRFAGIWWAIGWWPGGYVNWGTSAHAQDENGTMRPAPRALLQLCGLTLFLGTSVAVLGWEAGTRAILETPQHLALFITETSAWETLGRLMDEDGFRVTYGHLAIKMALFSLLPLPGLPGFQVVLAITEGVFKLPAPPVKSVAILLIVYVAAIAIELSH